MCIKYWLWAIIPKNVMFCLRVRSSSNYITRYANPKKRKWRTNNKANSGNGHSNTRNALIIRRFIFVLLRAGPSIKTNHRDDGFRSFLVREPRSCCSGSRGKFASPAWLGFHNATNCSIVTEYRPIKILYSEHAMTNTERGIELWIVHFCKRRVGLQK